MCCNVQGQQRFGAVVTEALGLIERNAELTVERVCRLQRERFGQVPEQLMKLPHDGKDLEHPRGRLRSAQPVEAAEGDL